MKKSTRRRFIRDTSLTATGLAVVSFTNKKDVVGKAAIGCAPTKISLLSGTITSVTSGKWSDPNTWGGRVPQQSDTPLISSGHTVIYDVASSVISGVNINSGGILQFDPLSSVLLQSSKNIVVEGKLVMKPASSSYNHVIRFIGINENNFIGGGMSPIASDVGLWVMGTGVLDLKGAEKTSWTNLSGSTSAGSTSITLKIAPQGWKVGDEIFVVPTEKPAEQTIGWDAIAQTHTDSFAPKFERRKITSINGATITLNTPLLYNHNQVISSDGSKTWTAEVGNLSRNVLIEGTENGKTHVFIRSSQQSNFFHIAIRYVGPRKIVYGQFKDRPNLILGRYGLHFHHCMDGSRGAKVVGCAIYDCGSRGYVPHVSHGITMSNNIAFNFLDTPFWYDEGDVTHDSIWEDNLMALCTYVPGTMFASKGMFLGQGDGNIARRNVAVYTGVGDTETGGAFTWAERNEGVWVFENNMSHSNNGGLWVWQNTTRNHTIDNYDSYNNTMGIVHGAYMNAYLYTDGYHYNSPILVNAASRNGHGVVFTRIVFDGAGIVDYPTIIQDSPISPIATNKYINCTYRNFTKAGLLVTSQHVFGDVVHKTKWVDIVSPKYPTGGTPYYFDIAKCLDGNWVRLQPIQGQPVKTELISRSAVTKNIAPFAPVIWGNGKGLKGEYFNGPAFDSFAFSQTDSMVIFDEWNVDELIAPTGVHYAIKGDSFSVRWTGKIEAQYTEPYTFYLFSGGCVKLWINNVLVINNWVEMFDITKFAQSQQINLIAGQKYDIKIEHANYSGWRGCILRWKCPSMEKISEVPQSQLYTDNIVTISPTPTNQGPVANAGADQIISLPTSEITLNGSASIDADGTIASFKWSCVSGPAGFIIQKPTEATTLVNNLVQGTYIFRLQVADDKGATHQDDVMVTVNPAAEVANQNPIANAGADIVLTLPVNSTTLNGTLSRDADGSIVSFKWLKVSGPSQYSIVNPGTSTTAVNNLVQGTYVFRLQVTDDKGATSEDDVMVIVNGSTDPNTSTEATNLRVTIAPNPTKSFFRATIIGSSSNDIKYSLFNRYGVLIETQTCRSGETITVGKKIKPGTYYGVAEQGTQKVSVTLIKL